MADAEASWPEVLAVDNAFGVYVHVPFCWRRCPYCDFDIAVRKSVPHRAYGDAVKTELAKRAGDVDGRQLRTIYFGGGTPTLLDPTVLVELKRAVEDRFGSPVETTVEANPEDIDEQLLGRLVDGGFDRVSLGVQSLDPAELSFLGRRHTTAEALSAIELAQRHVGRVSVDVIFGSPGQSLATLHETLHKLADTGVEHVSAYSLTIEPQTPFGRRLARGTAVTVEDDRMADLFDGVDAALEPRGFERYEVSNLARPGGWSRHNLLYWMGGEYLGLGLGAHSLRRWEGGAAERRAGGRDLRKYLSGPGEHVGFIETLDSATHLAERLFTALRTRFGVSMEALTRDHGQEEVARYVPTLDRLTEQGLITTHHDRLVATRRGLRFADSVAREIVSAMP